MEFYSEIFKVPQPLVDSVSQIDLQSKSAYCI